MGIHFPVKVAAPELAALAQCGWSVPAKKGPLSDIIGSEGTIEPRIYPQRSLPADDFCADWCLAEFGPAVALPAAQIFSRMDGRLPRPACWALGGKYGSSAGPGIVGDPDPRPWETVAREYAFADEFAALRPRVTGAGNRARFGYWLAQFQYLKAMGRLRCTRSVLDQATDHAEKDFAAVETALRARRQLVTDWGAIMTHLLEAVDTPGEMGTVANLELHTRLSGGYLTNSNARLERVLGKPLSADCAVPGDYTGKARLIVPTVRSVLARGQAVRLKIIVLDRQPPSAVTVHFRPLARGGGRLRRPHIGVGCMRRSCRLPQVISNITSPPAETSSGPRPRPGWIQPVVVLE